MCCRCSPLEFGDAGRALSLLSDEFLAQPLVAVDRVLTVLAEEEQREDGVDRWFHGEDETNTKRHSLVEYGTKQ